MSAIIFNISRELASERHQKKYSQHQNFRILRAFSSAPRPALPDYKKIPHRKIDLIAEQ